MPRSPARTAQRSSASSATSFTRTRASTPCSRRAREQGFRIAVFSDGSFRQFGPCCELRKNDAEGPVRNDGSEFGKAGERGRQEQALRDALLDRAVSATDTLVVMGDHGHDERGAHLLGREVPTLALYRGPAFTPGADLGVVSITPHRALLGRALGLAVPASYGAAWWIAVPLFLLPPTVYRYGAAGILAPAWLFWAGLALRKEPGGRWPVLLALAALLSPFLVFDAVDLHFAELRFDFFGHLQLAQTIALAALFLRCPRRGRLLAALAADAAQTTAVWLVLMLGLC